MGNSKKTDIWTPEIQKQAEALRPRLDIGGDGGIRTHDPGVVLRIHWLEVEFKRKRRRSLSFIQLSNYKSLQITYYRLFY